MSTKATSSNNTEIQNYRLSKSIIPEHYQIELCPDLEQFTFDGNVEIKLTIKDKVDCIVLNAIELEIFETQIENLVNQAETYQGTNTLDETLERATICFTRPLEPGQWLLKIKFSGILNDKLHGFYRSTYKDADGNTKVIASTQMEATDARRAFPCFDEPEFKAAFKVKLVIDQDLTAISNSPIESTTNLANGKKSVVFKDTMKMSTYLVAFMVGDFEHTHSVEAKQKAENGVEKTIPITVYCIPGKKHLGNFSLEIGKFALEYFARYFGVNYPGEKLDMIAIPDFAFGAMENLGAVTYRENILLIDENIAAHTELERVADVVSHELAHMWFGDLVTMKWWNGIWLNEAFATFMELLCVDAAKPDWKRWDSFGISRSAALSTDGLSTSRPIEFNVIKPEDAGAMFDVLTYEKGASVLRMLEQYLGSKRFQAGIAHYIQKHQYGNTDTMDLFDAIEEKTAEPIKSVMDSWIFQAGYPLVKVELENGDDHKKQSCLKLSQKRFLYETPQGIGQELYQIPMIMKVKTSNKLHDLRLIMTEQTQILPFEDEIEWAMINSGGHGFYRVQYTPKLLASLTKQLSSLSVIERFNLLSDAWAQTIAGHLDLKSFLQLCFAFSNETDKNVVSVITSAIAYISKTLNQESRTAFESYVRRLLSPSYERLGLEPTKNESNQDKQLRALVVEALSIYGNDSRVQEQANNLYKDYSRGKKQIEPNLFSAILSTVAYTGSSTEYHSFLTAYRTAKTPQEEQRYLFALTAFRQKDLLKTTLEKTLDGEIRTQNAPFTIARVMNNYHGGELAWEFTKSRWSEIISKFPENTLIRLVEGVQALVSKAQEEDVKNFFSTHTVKYGGKSVQQHLEKQHIAVLFKEREEHNFLSAFD